MYLKREPGIFTLLMSYTTCNTKRKGIGEEHQDGKIATIRQLRHDRENFIRMYLKTLKCCVY